MLLIGRAAWEISFRKQSEAPRVVTRHQYGIFALIADSMGAIHSTKISGNFGPKLNGSVRSNRKSFEKTGPPFEVVLFSRSDRSEFWLNRSRPISRENQLFSQVQSTHFNICNSAFPVVSHLFCFVTFYFFNFSRENIQERDS